MTLIIHIRQPPRTEIPLQEQKGSSAVSNDCYPSLGSHLEDLTQHWFSLCFSSDIFSCDW